MSFKSNVAGTGHADADCLHATCVAVNRESERLLCINPASPIKSDRCAGQHGKSNTRLKIKTLRSRITEPVPIHIYGIGVVIYDRDERVAMTTHGICASALNVRRELTRGIHEADVVTGA